MLVDLAGLTSKNADIKARATLLAPLTFSRRVKGRRLCRQFWRRSTCFRHAMSSVAPTFGLQSHPPSSGPSGRFGHHRCGLGLSSHVILAYLAGCLSFCSDQHPQENRLPVRQGAADCSCRALRTLGVQLPLATRRLCSRVKRHQLPRFTAGTAQGLRRHCY